MKKILFSLLMTLSILITLLPPEVSLADSEYTYDEIIRNSLNGFEKNDNGDYKNIYPSVFCDIASSYGLNAICIDYTIGKGGWTENTIAIFLCNPISSPTVKVEGNNFTITNTVACEGCYFAFREKSKNDWVFTVYPVEKNGKYLPSNYYSNNSISSNIASGYDLKINGYYYNYSYTGDSILPNEWQNPVNGNVDMPQNWTQTQVRIKTPGDSVRMDSRTNTYLDVVVNGKVFVNDCSSLATTSSLKGAISGSCMFWLDDKKVTDFLVTDDNVTILSNISDIKNNKYYTFQVKGTAVINGMNEGGTHKMTFGCNVANDINAFGIGNKLEWVSCDDNTTFIYYVDENNDGIDDNTGETIPPMTQPSGSQTNNTNPDSSSNDNDSGIINSLKGLLNKATDTVNGMKDLINGFSSAVGSMFAFLPSPIGEFIVVGIVIMIIVSVIGFIRG